MHHQIARGPAVLSIRPLPLAACVRNAVLAMALAAGAMPALPAFADSAAGSVATARQDYTIAAGPLDDALAEFASRAGVTVQLDARLVSGRATQGLKGSYSVPEGFAQLLAGSGLEAVEHARGTYVLRTAPDAGNAAVLPTVSVVAIAGASTEFTHSYTSGRVSLGRGEQSLREIPQSVSVVTRQRMDDQNMTTLAAAMAQTTGIVAVPYGNGVVDFTARGYPLDQYQFDGLAATGAIGSYSTSSFDTAVFDRVEVLRGPAGLLQGAGEPSGTVNMARKRALKELTISGAAAVGSHGAYRGEIDLTGPLSQDGSLRGRLVAVKDDRGSYIDHGFSRKSVLYGTLEYDFTPATTLSVGVLQQDGTSRPNYGLPNYADGRLIDLPRSTFLGSSWNRQDERTTRYFADLEHHLDNGGLVRVAASRLERDSFQKSNAFGQSFPDPATGDMSFRQVINDANQKNESIDAFVSTPFQLLDRKHNLMLGASRATFRTKNGSARGPDVIRNIFAPDYDAPEPVWGPQADFPIEKDETAVYGQLRLKVTDAATAILGGRNSWWENRYVKNPANDFKVDGKFTPYAGFIVDVRPDISLYASYADVYQPQIAQKSDGDFVAPRTGKQYEIGAKGEWMDGRLNGHVALFRINDENRAVSDPADPLFSVASGKARSQGFEAEISGRMTPTWDLVAGYSYTQTKYLSDPNVEGLALSPDTPRHMLKLWSKHRFTQEALRKLSVGFGATIQSGSYAQDGDVRWEQGGYTLASALVEYQLGRDTSLALNVDNLFDKKYYARIAGFSRQSYYGEPRNVTLTLRTRF